EQGDAESMPYEDNTFDVVMSMFGAMFCPRPEITASELIRVCKPGGTIAMANWTADGLAGQMFKLSAKYLPPPNMPPPVHWGDPEVVRERFTGVSDIKTTPRIAEMTYGFPPAGVVEFFKTYFGPTVTTFQALREEDRETLTAEMEDFWSEHNEATDGTTVARGEYLEVIAVK